MGNLPWQDLCTSLRSRLQSLRVKSVIFCLLTRSNILLLVYSKRYRHAFQRVLLWQTLRIPLLPCPLWYKISMAMVLNSIEESIIHCIQAKGTYNIVIVSMHSLDTSFSSGVKIEGKQYGYRKNCCQFHHHILLKWIW